MSTIHSAFRILGATALAGLSGCSSVRVHLDLRTEIAKLPVTSMSVALPQGTSIAPGERSPLVAAFTDASGKTWTTEGEGKGRILWRDIAVMPTVVTYKSGVLRLPADPRRSDGLIGHVAITVPSHPALHAELDVPVRYNYPFFARYSGNAGTNGTDGVAGTNGADGTTGSFDPDHPSAGGNGGNGSNGTDGSNGGDGDNGPSVEVFLTLRTGSPSLLECKVSARGAKDRFYLIDPTGGSLTVSSVAGTGGRGGHGGAGGRGGSGGGGSPPGLSGSIGISGSDGRNGYDGHDGSITIRYDPSAASLKGVLRVTRGQSTFLETPIGPLW